MFELKLWYIDQGQLSRGNCKLSKDNMKCVHVGTRIVATCTGGLYSPCLRERYIIDIGLLYCLGIDKREYIAESPGHRERTIADRVQ